MPTRVYITGTRIFVEQTGKTQVVIPQYRCKRTYLGNQDSDITKPIEFTEVSIIDIVVGTTITEAIDKIQDQSGNFIGDFNDVDAYFSTFILRGDSALISDDLATSENQEILIEQNAELKECVDDIQRHQESQKEKQEELLKQSKKHNLYLSKMSDETIKDEEVENY